jgi:site-specific DNA-methyltransferase (adenine-specific)
VLPEGTKVRKLKEIVLKDNSSFGSWDLSLLRKDWAEFDFGDWGIDVTWDTAGPTPDASVNEREVVEEEFDETTSDIEKRCKRGDIWQLGDHRLMCGDSTKVDDVQMLMGGGRG